MKIPFSRYGFLLLLLAPFMFVLGLTMQKYKYFPYPQVSDLGRAVATKVRSTYIDPTSHISQQYSHDTGKSILDKTLDTALLPLAVKGIRFSEYYPLPKVAGGITIVGNAVVVLDRLGALYAYRPDSGKVEKLPFPDLPNNLTQYVMLVNATVDDRSFRAHSVKFSASSNLLAVSHEYFDAQRNKTRMAVSVITIDPASLRPTGSWKTVYLSDAEPAAPNESSGGALTFAGQDKLYLTIGDYTVPKVAQEPNSSFGKVFEIDLGTLKARRLTIGHRNPQGLTLIKTGALLSTEHGPAGGDELNQIVEGSNYGWPNVTLGTEYGTYGWLDEQLVGRHDGYATPMFAWVPSIGVSNLIQVEGFHGRWDGDLLVASLKAQSLFRLRLDQTRVVYSEPIFIGQRIRDIAQLPDGTIVLWTDDTQLLLLSVDQQKLQENQRSQTIHDALRTQCMYCHHFGPTNPSDFAPSLSNVLERKIASDNFRYTAALRSKDGVWTEKALREFLANPTKFASGTSMPPLLNLGPDAIDEIIRDLGAPASAGN